MSQVLYIMRHGQTDMNVAHTIQGSTDALLNDLGRNQAKMAAHFFTDNNIRIDRVISSPLKRAVETAAITLGMERENVIINPYLTEMDFGKYEGVRFEDISDNDVEGIFSSPHKYVPESGESYYDVVKRAKLFLDEIFSTPEDINILAVTHGGILRAIACACVGKEIKDFWEFRSPNCCVYRLEKQRDAYSMELAFEGYKL